MGLFTMKTSTKKLQALASPIETIELSNGEKVTISQIRPFAKDGYHVIALIDGLQDVFKDVQGEFSLALMNKAVAKLLNPQHELHEHFKMSIVHVTGIEVEELGFGDLALIVAKAVEVNVGFFRKALPTVVQAVQAIAQ
jgi:hypothetical protein